MAYDRYDTRRERDSARHYDDRGFFERAGEQISSWFGDDDDDRQRGSEGRGERDRDWAPQHGWGGDPERGRDERSSRDGRGFEERRPTGQSHREGGGYRPMTGDYGRSEQKRGGGFGRPQSPWGNDDYRNTSYAGSRSSGSAERPHDRHYHEWRQRQLDELDREYDEYHRERQQHFENDFGSWRQTRQQKRQMLTQAREHMEVVGSDDQPVGKVDKIAGDRVILAKSDSPDGRHHSIPCTMIDRIEGDRVTLGCTAEQAKKKWHDEDGERALFEREGRGERGPHMLDRSFSGTYKD